MYWEREPFNVKATGQQKHAVTVKKCEFKKNQMRDFIIFIWIQKNWGNGSMSMQRMNIHTDMPEGF